MNTKIILGSGSPRRKELLANLGFTFEVRTKDTDESYPFTMNGKDVPTFLAKQKANALLSELSNNELLICADTVVVLTNEILGKPANKSEANAMLNRLSGNKHEVITGVFIGTIEKQIVFSEKTEVTFNNLSQADINFYIDNYQPFDKAGSYGIQEWIGAIGIKTISGSYSNVMGLPTDKVYDLLIADFKIKTESTKH